MDVAISDDRIQHSASTSGTFAGVVLPSISLPSVSEESDKSELRRRFLLGLSDRVEARLPLSLDLVRLQAVDFCSSELSVCVRMSGGEAVTAAAFYVEVVKLSKVTVFS